MAFAEAPLFFEGELVDADLRELRLGVVVPRPPAADRLGVDVDEVGLGIALALLGKGAGGGGGVVDDGAAVAVEQGGFKLLAGEAVEAGAVAADVLGPVVPVGVALQLDAFAEDQAGGLGGEALEEGGRTAW